LASTILGGAGTSCLAKRTMPGRVTCDVCTRVYSQRLGRCPSCFPTTAVTSAKEREREAEARAASWQKLSPAPLDTVSWEEATDVKWCHGGSGGVFVLKVPEGTVCVKGAELRAGELFAQLLATALGVRTAQLRVVGPHEPEIKSVRGGLQRATPLEEEHGMKRWKLASCDSLAVMEYVDGVPMMGMPAHQHIGAVRERTLWVQLGRLMAFDMLINNFDRLPLAWSNDGNLGNVMLSSRLGPVVGIDQCVNPIRHAAGLSTYLQRVRRAIEEARDGPARAFTAVKIAILNNTAIDLDDVEVRGLCDGCVELLTEVSRLSTSGELEQKLFAISSEVDRSFVAPDTSSEAALCCDLVRGVVATVRDALSV